jgi:hypothetical protein
MTRERCDCCGKFMSDERGYPPLEEDRCEDCADHERPSRLYPTGRRNVFVSPTPTQCDLRAAKAKSRA